MLELLFVIGFFVMLMVTGVSLLGVIAALVVATAIMFLGGMLALMIKLLPWLLLAIAVVWVIKAIKAPKVPKYQRYDRWRYYYPKYDATQLRAKVPSQELSDALVEACKENLKDK